MKKTSVKVLIALLLCIGMLAALLIGCGSSAAKDDAGANLSADAAYQAAISAEEGEECTSDECVVTLYDDTGDSGDYPYYVLSPLGAVEGR